jgi:hypothetical protein
MQKDMLLRQVAYLKKLCIRAGPPHIPASELLRDDGHAWTEQRRLVLEEANGFKDGIDLPLFCTFNLDPDPDIFFETLMGCIKNDIINYQIHSVKIWKKQKKTLLPILSG